MTETSPENTGIASIDDPLTEFGRFSIDGDENILSARDVRCDRISATPELGLVMISLVCETQVAKAIRAILATCKKVRMSVSGISATLPKDKFDYKFDYKPPKRTSMNLSLMGDNTYESRFYKLNYGLCHALYWSKDPGVMRAMSSTSLWEALNSDELTTPLMPHWLPWIQGELKKKRNLIDTWNWRCQCGILRVTTEDLDAIVSRGLREGHIKVVPPLSIPHFTRNRSYWK